MARFHPVNAQSCDDVLQCVFNLTVRDLEVFKALDELGETRADVLAQHLKKERSTIYRALQRLVQCGLCTKNTRTLEQGGYYHTYTCNDIRSLSEELERCLENWYQHMKQLIHQFQ